MPEDITGQAPSPVTVAEPVNKPDAALLESLRQRALEQIDQILPSPVQRRTFSYAELHAKKDEDQKFLIPELIPDEAVTILIGEDGIGKTQICTQLCLSICFHKKEFLGLPLHVRHGRALIVATEDSKQKFIKAATKQSYAINPWHKPEEVHLDFTEGSDFDDFLALKDEMEMLLGKNHYDLVVIDALGDLFTLIDGEINSNSHARKILSFFQHLCNTYSIAIIIIHHAAKSKIVVKQREGKLFVEKGDSQGAGAITQKARTVLALSNDPKTTAPDGSTYINYLHVVKANLMGKEYMQNALKLEFQGRSLLHTSRGKVDIVMMQEEAEVAVQQTGTPFGNNGNNRKPAPKELSDADHNRTLDNVFRGEAVLPKQELRSRLAAQYGVGMTKIDSSLDKGGYLAYLQSRGLLYCSEFGCSRKPLEEPKAENEEEEDVPF